MRALPMRKIRDLIRLKYSAHLSHEQIARALAISKGVVAKYVARLEPLAEDPATLLGREAGFTSAASSASDRSTSSPPRRGSCGLNRRGGRGCGAAGI